MCLRYIISIYIYKERPRSAPFLYLSARWIHTCWPRWPHLNPLLSAGEVGGLLNEAGIVRFRSAKRPRSAPFLYLSACWIHTCWPRWPHLNPTLPTIYSSSSSLTSSGYQALLGILALFKAVARSNIKGNSFAITRPRCSSDICDKN